MPRVAPCLAVFAAVALAAGCLDNPQKLEDPVDSPATERSTSWAWNTTAVLGPAAFVVEVHGAPETECALNYLVNIRQGEPHDQMYAVALFEWADGTRHRHLVVGGSRFGAFMEGVIDTRDTDGKGSFLIQSGYDPVPLYGGSAVITVLGRDVAPSPQGDEPRSIGVTVVCSDEVEVTSFQGGRELLFFMERSSAEGTGFWLPTPQSDLKLLVRGAVEASFKAPEVRMRGDSSGLEFGKFALIGPDGRTEWELGPQPEDEALFEERRLYETSGAPGDYRMELERVSGWVDTFWAALIGLHPLDHPDDLLGLGG